MPRTLDRTSRPELATAIDAALERLTHLPPGHHAVVSCYVRLGQADRAASRYFLTWKARAKEALAAARPAEAARGARLALERDLARIGGYLQGLGGLPHARSLAIFACEGLDLFLCIPLPRVRRTRVSIDESPRIAELVAARREARALIVAALDRALARFFIMAPGGTEELPGAFTVSSRGGKYHSDRSDAPGQGERRYHGRQAEDRHRHYMAVVKRLEELAGLHPGSGIVLAGPPDHTSALSALLPDPLVAQVVGTCRVNPRSVTASGLRGAVDPVAEAHEREGVTGELAALRESIGAGRGVEGAHDTLGALARHQVHTLYLVEDLEGSGFRCGAGGRLVLTREDCGGAAVPQPVRDVADEALEDALRDGAGVTVVPRNVAPLPVDGLAATLKFG